MEELKENPHLEAGLAIVLDKTGLELPANVQCLTKNSTDQPAASGDAVAGSSVSASAAASSPPADDSKFAAMDEEDFM